MFSGLFILLVTSFKPAGDYTISVKISSPLNFGQDSYYTIKGNKIKASINYLQIDSVYYLKVTTDKDFPKSSLKAESSAAEAEYYFRKNDSLIKIYSKHHQVTLSINAKQLPAYFREIDSLLRTPKDVLLYKSPEYTGYLDGATYHFDTNADGRNRKFYVSNPDEHFAPTLSHFLKTTWALFYPDKN